MSYAQISVALADIVYFKAALEDSKKYLSSLTGDDELAALKLRYVNNSCHTIETRYADVLAGLLKEIRVKNKDDEVLVP